jgi:hypothetical protein
MIARARQWEVVLVLACVTCSGAWAQDLTLTKDSEAGFRRFMQMAQNGALGAEIQNANIALMGAQARIELVRRDGPPQVLTLARRRAAGGASRYFEIMPEAHATPTDVALVGQALDACFTEDPFQFAGLEESLAGGPPPGIGDAWRAGGWRGLFGVLERRMMALATLEHTVIILMVLLLGFLTSLIVLWGPKPKY